MGRPKYDIEKIDFQYGEKIIADYLSGVHAEQISEEVFGNCKDIRYIYAILEKHDICKRTRSQVKQISDKTNSNPNLNGRRYQVNEHYFKKWSKNMAYLLGYIATDGCVYGDRVLKLGLSTKDQSFLEQIKTELNFEGPILKKTIHSPKKEYECSYMNIYNRTLVKDLLNLNIVSNKSLTLKGFDFIPQEYEMDFLCGVFDGDGSVGKSTGKANTTSIQIRVRFFSGSLEFISYIKEVMSRHGFSSPNILIEKRKNLFYSICYSTFDSLLFYDYYKEQKLFIDRKKETFSLIVNERKEYENNISNKNRLKNKH